MLNFIDEILFENLLAAERPRLVRLCAWFTGRPEIAEDLAQETLLIAWKSREQLSSFEKIKPWVSAIARNTCLKWAGQHAREQAHLIPAVNSHEDPDEEKLVDENSLELDLDRSELADLLDQALAQLPAQTAQMLIEHYIKESSHAEIAAMMGMNAGAVAVRLQRGKLTLKNYFETNLQAQSRAFGLIDESAEGWEETNIWCPICGQFRLMGVFKRDEPSGIFALRCQKCDPEPEMIMTGLDLTKPYNARLLANVKTYKPAYTRLLIAHAAFYQQALRSQTAACLACGKQAQIQIQSKRSPFNPLNEKSELQACCSNCQWGSNMTLSGMVIALPEAQRFWRDNPRMKVLPFQEIETMGSKAIITRLQSVSSAAFLEVISRANTFEVISIQTNVPL